MEKYGNDFEKYQIYERKKKKLLTKCKTFKQYEKELKKLIEELKI